MNYRSQLESILFYMPPLFWPCCAWMGGILAVWLALPPAIFLAMAIIVTISGSLLFIFNKQLRHFTSLLLIGPLFGASAYNYYQQLQIFKSTQELINRKTITIDCTINDISPIDHPRFKQLIYATIENIHSNKEIPAGTAHKKNIIIYSSRKTNFLVDDQIELENIQLKKPANHSICQYLLKEGAIGTIVAAPESIKLIDRPERSILRSLHQKKIALFETLKSKMSPKAFTFFSAFFLGNRKINKKENDILKQSCKYWGISHYLARSGLHLVMFIMIWEYLFRFIPLVFFCKQLLLLFLTLVYFILTWNSISFFRAFLTFICYKLFALSDVPTHTLHAIILVTITVLILNPTQLLFLDFQLSFGITFLLAWINQLRMHEKRPSLQNS